MNLTDNLRNIRIKNGYSQMDIADFNELIKDCCFTDISNKRKNLFDYIISNNVPVLLELNTVPGMTETSFIPQQVEAANLSMTDVLTEIIEFEYNKIKELKLS